MTVASFCTLLRGFFGAFCLGMSALLQEMEA